MLAKERPNLVSLAMRQADQHYAIGLEALRAGAHLYCEKPFTTTPAEADALQAEANQRGLKIAVAHTLRMMPAVVGLKQAMGEGLLGDIGEARAYGKQDARAGGEDMMVLGRICLTSCAFSWVIRSGARRGCSGRAARSLEPTAVW